ncbi:MAG: radical SAM protein [Bacteroidota bacterium]
MSKKYNITSEYFVISGSTIKPESLIVYFPLKSMVFNVNPEAAELLERIKTKGEPSYICYLHTEETFLDQLEKMGLLNGPEDVIPDLPYDSKPQPTRTILLLSDRCSLKCIYCYKDASIHGDLMPLKIAEATIDFIFYNAQRLNEKIVEVGFHGGGEPTLNWPVFTSSIIYTREKCKSTDIHSQITLCTNGIMSEEQARWVAENIDNIAVSLDGPPDIHNRQRPFASGRDSFQDVAKTLNFFDKINKKYSVRMTATELTDGRLPEIYQFIVENFKPHTVCIEPLYICGRCETSHCKPPAKESFIHDMEGVYELARGKYRVLPYYSGNRVWGLTTRFCGASGSNFFVTPQGLVTSCLEISDLANPKSDLFLYGKYNTSSEIFEFDIEKYHRLTQLRVHNFKECASCFIKWHCGGDCLSKTPDINTIAIERNKYRCELNKSLSLGNLLQQMKYQIEETTQKETNNLST